MRVDFEDWRISCRADEGGRSVVAEGAIFSFLGIVVACC